MPQDWFTQNAPAAAAPPPTGGDWFATNAPKDAPSYTSGEHTQLTDAMRAGIDKYRDDPGFAKAKKAGWDDYTAAKHAAYGQLPLLQQLKLTVVPGAHEKWEADTFNAGQYVPESSNLERVLRPTTGEVMGGAADIGEGNVAGGAHRIITGTGRAALPLLPGAAAKAPGAVLRAAAGGYFGGKLSEMTAEGLGATPDQAALSGDVGNIVGGGIAAGTTPGSIVGLAKKGASAAAKSVAKNVGPEGIDTLEFLTGPKKYLFEQFKKSLASLPENASENTHPATHQAIVDALDVLKNPEPTGSTAHPGKPGEAFDYVGKRPEPLLPTPMVGSRPATEVMRPGATQRLLPGTIGQMSSGKSAAAIEPAPTAKPGSIETIPRTQNGETVIQQALLSLDKPTLMRIAKARGISTTQEANLIPSKANPPLVKKIGDSLTQDEIDNARDMGIEMSRNAPVQNLNIAKEAGTEAWHYKVMKTFFPDVEMPKAMQARAQKTIAQRPDYSATYQQAAKSALGAAAKDTEVQGYADLLKYQDEHTAELLLDSINQIQAGKLSTATRK